MVNAITSAGGWDLSLDLGSQIARQLGGSGQVSGTSQPTGLCLKIGNVGPWCVFMWEFVYVYVQLAKGDVMAFNIGVSVRLTLDEGYDPPQGRCGGLPDACTQTQTQTTPLLATRQHAQRVHLSCVVRRTHEFSWVEHNPRALCVVLKRVSGVRAAAYSSRQNPAFSRGRASGV